MASLGWVIIDGVLTFNGAVNHVVNGLTTTSTDGITLANNTAATAGVPVQMSPRLRFSGAGYNSVSTLSETNSFFWEVLPATVAGTTTAKMRLGYISPSGVTTYPIELWNIGRTIALGDVFTGAAGSFSFTSRAIMASPADGQITYTTNDGTIGSRIKADALPTISSGFGGGAAITAGSTPFAGSINVGTTPGTGGVINFNGTAFSTAPFVIAQNNSTAADTVKASTSLTQLTITAAALANNDIIHWICVSPK